MHPYPSIFTWFHRHNCSHDPVHYHVIYSGYLCPLLENIRRNFIYHLIYLGSITSTTRLIMSHCLIYAPRRTLFYVLFSVNFIITRVILWVNFCALGVERFVFGSLFDIFCAFCSPMSVFCVHFSRFEFPTTLGYQD